MSRGFDPAHEAEFDAHAGSYDEQHRASITLSGEDPSYFARYKKKVLERVLGPGFSRPVLDFGCGIGNLTELLVDTFPVVHGYDPSAKSIAVAQGRSKRVQKFFFELREADAGNYGAVVLANVLHHVAPADRSSLMNSVACLLAPAGKLVIFEHNPLNPVTRHAVAACPFDENAVLLWPWQATRLLRDSGLTAIHRDFIVFFPRPLAALRRMEATLRALPLGAQFCAWGTKP